MVSSHCDFISFQIRLFVLIEYIETITLNLRIKLMDRIIVGFMGAGGIARAHAYSLNAVKFYYPEVPEIIFESVTSKTPASREDFATRYSLLKV